MINLIFIFCVLCVLVVAEVPEPPLWGGAQQWSSGVLFTDPADSPLPDPTWHFDYFYDEVNSWELYRHVENNGDLVCIQHGKYPAGDACNVRRSSERTVRT